MKSAIGKDIKFFLGLPKFNDHLREIDPKCNNVLIFDDLMSTVIQSPNVSQIYIQGRHRTASVILLLQKMFPKGHSTQIFVGMHSTWLYFAALATENKSVLLPNVCLIRITSDSCPLITKKRISLFIRVSVFG